LIEILPETGSTNADLAARLKSGEYLREGDWLVADRQTQGKGRQGREWHDGAGNFMGSTPVHLHEGAPPPQTLALVAGLALHELVTPHVTDGHDVRLKWPNDLMIGGCKLAGILLERVLDTVIIGIGVNLRFAPTLPDRGTIALSQCGHAPSRDDFAADLANRFDIELQRWRNYGLAPIIARWLDCAHERGTWLEVNEPGGTQLSGAFDGLDREGMLQLRLADGSRRVIHAGEVLLASDRD
jgi:BirA family biotin operon repressor/biotin-[acetyl-CoA-carboxylase] ligase